MDAFSAISGVVAVAVGAPDRILIGARIFPGNVIPGRRLHRADRRPADKLTRHNRSAGIGQLGIRTTAVIKEIIFPNLGQAGRPKRVGVCLDHRSGRGWRRHRHIEGAGRCAGPGRRRIGGGEGIGAGRQGRRGEAPGAGAARGRSAEGGRAAIRHRHRRTIRCGPRQGHRLVGIFNAGADGGSGRSGR